MSAASLTASQTQVGPRPKTIFIWGLIGIVCYVVTLMYMASHTANSWLENMYIKERNLALISFAVLPFVVQLADVLMAVTAFQNYTRAHLLVISIGGTCALAASAFLWYISFATYFVANPWPTFICAGLAMIINVIGLRASR